MATSRRLLSPRNRNAENGRRRRRRRNHPRVSLYDFIYKTIFVDGGTLAPLSAETIFK